MPFVNDGRVRGLGITSLKRAAAAPNLPTVAEQGYPGFEALSWFGILAPKGTPKPILDKIYQTTMKALAEPDLKPRVAALGLELLGTTPDDMKATMERDIPKWAKVIEDAKIAPSK